MTTDQYKTQSGEMKESNEELRARKDHQSRLAAEDFTERKIAADESVRFQANLLDTVEQAVIATNLDGIVIYWNKFAQRLYGWTPQEAIGRHIMELTTPEAMAEQALEILSHLRRGKSWTGEFNVQHRDGTQFPVQIVNSRINDDNGELIGIVGISSDITERKRAEQALRESENKYRLLVEQASDGIHTYDMQGNFIETNSKLCQMLGYTPEELLRHNVKDLIPAEDLAVDPINFDELRAGKTILKERRLRRKDGVLLPVEISGSMIRDNVLQAIIRDTTERKRQEDSLIELTRQLERQTNVFNTTLSSITDFAYIFDREGRFLYANQPLLDLWGLTLDEAVGKNFFDLQYPDDLASRLQRQIQQVIDTRQGLRDETLYTSLTGVQGFYEYIFAPVFSADGTVEVVAGSTRDITDRKRVETALRESRERLQMAMNAAKIYSWEMNLATQQIEWSNNLERVLGFQLPADFPSVVSSIHVDDREVTAKLISQAIAGGDNYESEFRLVNPQSREIVWVSGQGVLVGNAQNSQQRFVGITQNITERKQADEALRLSQSELQKSHEELERRVGERTLELSEMNAVLQEEVRERRRIEGERLELLRRIVFAQEDERRRIAREMHDQLGQQLTVMKLKLDAVKEGCGENQKLCEQLEALQTLARQLDEDVDHMVWEMRPTVLDDLGLQAALSSYVQNWSKHFSVPVQLHARGMDKIRLTPEIETALYRIAQEALNNIAKHAQAGEVAIVLERRADQVSLIIEDDGIGFDLQQVLGAHDKGLGLVGLRERAALFSGTVEIESQPDEGTTVVVRIPAPPAPQAGAMDE